jgi:hypothetical protein
LKGFIAVNKLAYLSICKQYAIQYIKSTLAVIV